jgi:hypothetical protein
MIYPYEQKWKREALSLDTKEGLKSGSARPMEEKTDYVLQGIIFIITAVVFALDLVTPFRNGSLGIVCPTYWTHKVAHLPTADLHRRRDMSLVDCGRPRFLALHYI